MLRTCPGGTASMPFREKWLNERVFSQSVPLSRPAPVQTGAKVRGFSPTGLEFTAETDSLLERAGFELSVPGDGELCWGALTLGCIRGDRSAERALSSAISSARRDSRTRRRRAFFRRNMMFQLANVPSSRPPDHLRPAHPLDRNCGFYVHAVFYWNSMA